MYFDSLKQKCEYYRGLTDYRLLPNSYVLIMLDGRSFSKKVKNKFNKPFDSTFVYAMNETAKYLCENVEGCKFAYTQSDEITLLVTDFDTPETDSFFSYRLTKILSVCAALATSKFNQIMLKHKIASDYLNDQVKELSIQEIIGKIDCAPLYEFDCKAWNVPSANEVYAWFLYRQHDCVRNSKSQTCQTYLPHKQLVKLTCDMQVELLKSEKGIDWNDFDNGLKYGRFVYKEETKFENGGVEYVRNKFTVHPGFPIDGDSREKFLEISSL